MGSAEQAYLFRHAMMRLAAYELQPPTARSELHAHALAIIEALPADDPDLFAFELADHAHFATAALPDARRRHELQQREAHWLSRAIERARNNSSFQIAHELAARLAALEVAEPEARHGAALMAAEMAGMLGLFEAVPGYLDSADQISTEPRLKANALLCRVGTIHLPRREFEAALTALHEARETYRAAGDQGAEARALGYLGNVHAHRGEREEAFGFYTQSLEVFEKTQSWRGVSTCRGNLGLMHKYFERFEEAEHSYREALAIDTEHNNREGIPRHLGNLAVLYRDQNRLNEAVDLFKQADDLFRELGNRPGMMRNLINFADCHERLGQLHRAVSMFATAERLADECGLAYTRADAIYHRANALLKLNDHVRGEAAMLGAAAAYDALDDQRSLGDACYRLAECAFLRGEHELVFEHSARALQGWRAAGAIEGEHGFKLLAMHAEAALARNELATAAESAAAALDLAAAVAKPDPIQLATLKAIIKRAS